MENMGGLENQSLKTEFEQKGAQKISVSDSFIVDMERFSHIIEKDTNSNSRITLQRNLSRKGSLRGGERKTNSSTANEKDTNLSTTSPRASLLGASTPEKSMVVTVGTTDHSTPQVHNQITMVAGIGGATTTAATATATENKVIARRFSFRRSTSSPLWTVDPRRILFFFATLSSMGTILLIFFTLSMAKFNGEDNAPN